MADCREHTVCFVICKYHVLSPGKLCAQHKSMKKELHEKAGFGAKKISKEKKATAFNER